MYRESHVYFFNTDISLIITVICLKICMFIAEICMEGKVSQNFDLVLGFWFMLCRKRHLKKSQRLPVFYHKIKTKA